jgi:hypothetical protein
MNDNIEIKIGSTIYDKIDASRLSALERQVAINALRDADLIVDALVWVIRKIEQLGARLFLKPGLKH